MAAQELKLPEAQTFRQRIASSISEPVPTLKVEPLKLNFEKIGLDAMGRDSTSS